MPLFSSLPVLVLALSLNAPHPAAAALAAKPNCRCLFGDPCWPSAADFSALAARVSQPLLQPLPPAAPCYPIASPSGDCASVRRLWTDPSWRANQPGAMQGANFETFTFRNDTLAACFMNTALGIPCQQGSVPVAGVDARNEADIRAAVSFAVSHNLRLVVKNTGHDLSGRSTARGSFMVWLHRMNDITFHDTFRTAGAPPSEVHRHAVTLGPGVQWQDAYEFVNSKNRVLVGGLSSGGTVGAAGGWVLGGGHSALSPKFGLGVDNVLEFTMISSNGTKFFANAHSNPDLFFALRGGGGGTYGVVTSVTYQTHPNLPLVASVFSATTNSSAPTPGLKSILTSLIETHPNLSDAGWGGFASLAPDPSTGNLGLSALYVLFNGTSEQANRSMDPFFATARAASNAPGNRGALAVQSAFTTPIDSFFTWYTQFFPPSTSAGSNGALGSWLLPRAIVESAPERVADTLLPLTGLTFLLVGGGAVARADPDAMGLNPAWRKALVHTIFATGWAEGTSVTTINGRIDGIRQNMTTLRALAPESGAYFNEGSLVEPNPQQAFFGDHFDKLKAIKTIYDPLGLFVVPEGVGSEDWDGDLVCKVSHRTNQS